MNLECAGEVLALIISLPGTTGETTWMVAEAIARESNSSREAAELVTLGYFESGFRDRIQLGDCRSWECDRGLARGYFQSHRDRSPGIRRAWDGLLGLEEGPIRTSTGLVAEILDRGRRICPTSAGAISYYAVGTCNGFAGAERRGRFSERIRVKLPGCDADRAPPLG